MEERDDMNDNFTAEVTFEGDETAVIRVVGEVDLATVDTLRTAVAAAIKDDPGRVVFDLSGVEFMDSSGITVLLEATTTANSVLIRRPSDSVRSLIEATGLSEILHVEPF